MTVIKQINNINTPLNNYTIKSAHLISKFSFANPQIRTDGSL